MGPLVRGEEVHTAEAPPLAAPGQVLREARSAFLGDPPYRRVVIVNFAFLAVFLASQWVLRFPLVVEPLLAILLYFPLAIGQWRFWKWGDLDVKAAVGFVRLHQKAFKDVDPIEKLERPDVVRGDHFRVGVARGASLKRAAVRAMYLYTIALTMGAIFSTIFLPISLGQQLTAGQLAGRSTIVALLTVTMAFCLGWIIPPLWLIEEAGFRYYSRRLQSVELVSKWYLIQLGPFLGIGALGTFFLVYYIAGFGLVDAIFALLTLSISLYPAALTATFLYGRYREGAAVERLKSVFDAEGVPEFPSIVTALVRLPPK